MKNCYLPILFLFISTVGVAQTNALWRTSSERGARSSEVFAKLEAYKTFSLDVDAMKQQLARVPKEGSVASRVAPVEIEIPLPDGNIAAFQVQEYVMMEPGLADKYPAFKTYYGVRGKDRSQTVRLDWTANGLNAMVVLPKGVAFLKPAQRGNIQEYVTYFDKDYLDEDGPLECGTVDEGHAKHENHSQRSSAGDCQFRTYRLAVAVTGEYATSSLGASSAGTAADDQLVTSHIVTSINQINGMYERDVTARLVLINNLADVFYYDGANDPYTNSNSITLLTENVTNLNAVIGSGNYDIGHVLGNTSFGSGGVASLNSVCSTNSKARGVTRASAGGIQAPRFLKVWAHEMGHQFGAGHTQNENCQRSSTSAMETGAGTTLMSYVTSNCANQVQSVPDYYFHAISIQQMSSHMLNTSCATILPSTNQSPTVSAGLDVTVPHSTPLLLVANASDPDGDPLTYTWEQFDNETAQSIPPAASNTQGPAFRSFPPTADNERYLPNQSAVLNGTTPTWEVLPGVSRQMEWRVTVRDNSTNSISCTAEDNMLITTTSDGPFEVITANTGGTIWFENQPANVSWAVANTNVAPVNCGSVDILFSTDNGQTFPITLASNVPNTGSASITVPSGLTTSGRVQVRCSNNIFYNVSEASIEVQAAASTFFVEVNPSATTLCPGTSSNLTVNTTTSLGFTGTVSLSVLNLPAGVTAQFGTGAVPAGQSTPLTLIASGAFTPGLYNVDVVGVSGGVSRAASLQVDLQDAPGIANLISPSQSAVVGTTTPIFAWSAVTDVIDYEIQLSTGVSFASLITNATVTTNAYTQAMALPVETEFFWRVRARTACGFGVWSLVNSFETGNCLPGVIQNTPVSISGSGTPTVTSTITVSQAGTVESVQVSDLIGSHSWVADLRITLIGPDGVTSAVLLEDLCGSGDDFDLSLSDAATVPVGSAPCDPLGQGGTFLPEDPLVVFQGAQAAGNWTLQIEDLANGDGGTLNNWTLDLCLASTVPLPVELLSFDATAGDDAIHVHWATASEVDNAGFSIERSTGQDDGFVSIARVAPSDTPFGKTSYAEVDRDVLPDVTYYYRLVQKDYDGTETISEIRSAKLSSPVDELRVRPNPVRNELYGYVDVGASEESWLSLYDVQGRLVRNQRLVGPRFMLMVNDLAPGVYVLEVSNGRTSQTKRVQVK